MQVKQGDIVRYTGSKTLFHEHGDQPGKVTDVYHGIAYVRWNGKSVAYGYDPNNLTVVTEQRKPSSRNFLLVRTEDESGVSGTGVVAEGVQFTSGVCVLSWLTQYDSVGVYPSAEELEAIHGHGGKTKIQWV